ncbi:MAG TPA: phosphatidylcholine synthase [Xanthobacteraceae bacterium]|jgi:phosphatidylcholine synthase
MVADPTPQQVSPAPLIERAGAFAVHGLTALGAVFGLLALLAAIESVWIDVFFWLAVAVVVDAVDGPLARRFKVAETLPRWSGATLDFIVDYLTWVFVPVVALVYGNILPERFAFLASGLILITSAIYFADTRMKTDDAYFRGFPAAWNLVAYYLFLVRPDPYLALALVVILCALTFAPVRFVHPLRVEHHRLLNIVLLALWGVLGVVSLVTDLAPPPAVTYGLVAIALYFLIAGALRHPRFERN